MSNEDHAQVVELEEWKRNNRPRTPEPTYKPGENGYGPEICTTEECDNPLQDKRREYGYTICVECKAGLEAAGKHLRRQ
jgi:hypothetical protein